VDLVRDRTTPTEWPPLVGEVSANFWGIGGCRVVSAADPYGHILGFLDRRCYFFFQVAPQLYSRGRVDPVSDPLLLDLLLGTLTTGPQRQTAPGSHLIGHQREVTKLTRHFVISVVWFEITNRVKGSWPTSTGPFRTPIHHATLSPFSSAARVRQKQVSGIWGHTHIHTYLSKAGKAPFSRLVFWPYKLFSLLFHVVVWDWVHMVHLPLIRLISAPDNRWVWGRLLKWNSTCPSATLST
jgi:hypothetical protein